MSVYSQFKVKSCCILWVIKSSQSLLSVYSLVCLMFVCKVLCCLSLVFFFPFLFNKRKFCVHLLSVLPTLTFLWTLILQCHISETVTHKLFLWMWNDIKECIGESVHSACIEIKDASAVMCDKTVWLASICNLEGYIKILNEKKNTR